jgi:hypothetical protein
MTRFAFAAARCFGVLGPGPTRRASFYYAEHFGFRRLPMRVDAQDAALNVALLAEAETRRGVRTVRG